MRWWSWLLRLLAVGALLAPTRCQEDDVDDGADLEEESLSGEQLRALHAKFDADGDGKVSFNEIMDFSSHVSKAMATADVLAILEEVDTSKDGKLSLQEHLDDIQSQVDASDEEEARELDQRKAVERAKFAAADSNGDQLLDTAELSGLFYPEIHEGVLGIAVREVMRQKDGDGDGKLDAKEFWELDSENEEDGKLLEEERIDFAKLDADNDGFLNAEELRHWESGRFHIEDAMKKLFATTDTDNDMHVSAEELVSAREQVAATDAQFHLIEWAEHHEL